MAKVVKGLPSKYKALSSNPSTSRKKRLFSSEFLENVVQGAQYES
jgi:hypothetical protein